MFDHALTLKWPKERPKAAGRILHGQIDMQFDKGTREYVPSRAPISFHYDPYGGGSGSSYQLNLSEVASPLMDDTLSQQVVEASSAINIHFTKASEDTLGSEARCIVRKLSLQSFSPHCFVWRLASMYLTAAWCESNGDLLNTAAYTDEFIPITSLAEFSNALICCYDSTINPIMVYHDQEPSRDVRKLLPILALATCDSPQYLTAVDLPAVSTEWPILGPCALLFCGPMNNRSLPGPVLTKELVYEAALLYCKFHGCVDLFIDYIDTIAVLWTSREPELAPIFETSELTMDIPKLDTLSTLLLPISHPPNYSHLPSLEYPLQMFCRGVNTRLIITLLIRIANEPGTTPNIVVAQKLAWAVGYTGYLGPLLNLQPLFPDSYALEEWWDCQSLYLQEGRIAFPTICRKLAYVH